MRANEGGLPVGWEEVALSELVCAIEKVNPSEYPRREISYIDIGSIDNDGGVVTAPKVIPGNEAPSRARQAVIHGDILFSTVRPYLKAIAQVPSNLDNPVASTGFCVLRAHNLISKKYLFFFVRSDQFLQSLIPLQRGVSYPAVRNNDVLSRIIPLAPGQEQARIVEKLEELLSDLDNGVAELKAAQIKLSQYRQSLLKSAVEGSLTADWREKNAVDETGEQLLQRILKERRERWEAEKLAEFEAKGKKPPKNWQSKYPEPVEPDTSELFDLPAGWVWASVMATGKVQLGRQRSPKYHSGDNMVPYLRVANVFEDRIDITDLKSMHFSTEDEKTYRLEPGDVLLNEGQSLELVGRPAIFKGEVDRVCFTNTLVRYRPSRNVLNEYALLVFRYYMHSGRFQRIAKITTNIAHLGAARFAEIEIPVPPKNEQFAILERFSEQSLRLEKQVEDVLTSLAQAEAQRKNILKAAFSGRLVAQNPNDEPASELLERIKAERAEVIVRNKSRGPKKKDTNQVMTMRTIEEVLKIRANWVEAQEVFQECGVSDGAETVRIEELYAELRNLDKAGRIEVERHGDCDMLRLKAV